MKMLVLIKIISSPTWDGSSEGKIILSHMMNDGDLASGSAYGTKCHRVRVPANEQRIPVINYSTVREKR